MTSQITTDNIDATFPEAGKDNDSQGFRDNFSVIKTNFLNAKTEIEALQTKAILSSPLDGEGTTTNNLGGSNIYNGTHTNFRGTASTNSSVGSSANVDFEKGDLHAFTLSTDATLTFVNWPQSNEYAKIRLHLRSSSTTVSVGNDVIIGRRYSIDSVNDTDFIDMGAEASAVVSCRIGNETSTTSSGNILHVETVWSGTIDVGSYLIVDPADANASSFPVGVRVIGRYTGSGGGTGKAGKYIIDYTGNVSALTRVNCVTVGLSFIATSKGFGTGTVNLWKQATLTTENGGDIKASSNFSLPLELNPNGEYQVLEAWTWTGSTSKEVYVDYVANLDTTETNYTALQAGTLAIDGETNSIDFQTTDNALSGAVQIAGGVSIAKDINVNGNGIINGDFTVRGTLNAAGLEGITTTVGKLTDIGDVVTDGVSHGDTIRWNADNSTWSTAVDTISYSVAVYEYGDSVRNVFWIKPYGSEETPVALKNNSNEQYDLKFQVGKKYRFYQEASTVFAVNSSHPSGDNNTNYPLRFSRTPDTITILNDGPGGTISAYSNNVTVSGTAGNAGAYVEILITEDTPSPLFLYAKDINGAGTDKVGGEMPIQVTSGPVKVVSNYSPKRSQTILVDTVNEAITITLPSDPELGTTITVVDAGNASTNAITIDRNSANINGIAENVIINGNNGGAILTYNDRTGWTAISLSYSGSDELNSDLTSFDISANSSTAPKSWYTAVTYFNPGTDWDIVLDDGREGQIKTFIQAGGAGTATLTVSSAGWIAGGGEGTIRFSNTGNSATLQFVNGEWHVISNVNCVVNTLGGLAPAFLIDTPLSLSAPGEAGNLSYDSTKLYVCTATDTWGEIIFDNVAGTTRATFVSVPLSASSSGVVGQMAANSAYLYVCVATDTWKRISWDGGW